jgi:hypothetical protein
VWAEEEPHTKAKEGHHGRKGVEKVCGKKVSGGIIIHVPVGIVFRGVHVHIYCIKPREGLVVAHLFRRAVRRSAGHEQREQDDAKGAHTQRRIEGLGVESFASNRDVAGKLEGREAGKALQVGIDQGIFAITEVPSVSQV